MLTYSDALAYLNQFINYERSQPQRYAPETLSLDRVNQLLDRLGRPDRAYRAIHIAGTALFGQRRNSPGGNLQRQDGIRGIHPAIAGGITKLVTPAHHQAAGGHLHGQRGSRVLAGRDARFRLGAQG